MSTPPYVILILFALAGIVLGDITINVAGFTFSPQDATIATGDTVTWIAIGSHNVAQTDSPTGQTHTGNSPYSGAVGAVSSYSFQFTTPGVFYYICEAHLE
jgi:plastocyanin